MYSICEIVKSELNKIDEKSKKMGKLNSQEMSYVKLLTGILKNFNELEFDEVPKPHSIDEKSYNYVDEWICNMVNEDGTKGAYWTKYETTEVAKNNGITFDTISEDDWYITMNMIYSDYSNIAKKYGTDSISFYVDLSKQWLWDRDTKQGKSKLMSYYYNIVKH